MTDVASHLDHAGRRGGRVRRARGSIGLNLTAMIDVVFLLLIYFMAATRFMPAEEVYPMDLPQRSAAPDPYALDDEPVRIEVTSRDERQYGLRVDGPYPQPATFRDLSDMLDERRVAPGHSGGLFMADHPMYIAPDSNARWDHVLGAYNAVVRAGYDHVVLLPPP